ncbi:MAG: methyltransferase domain-containing protein [Planctomycetia bacterium]|nr:methyltransferase domain-containing protein [Planctomycetia bacterium]
MQRYVHGYSAREMSRLQDQADTLAELLHHDTRYPAGSRVLEAGCGVGSQTITLAANSPGARFTAVDINPESLAVVQRRVRERGLTNVAFQQVDLLDPPFPPGSFDHVFVCFVLEHLPDPMQVLRRLRALLVPGGTITVIEGDHGSAFFSPPSELAMRAIACQITLQARGGGDACIGRRLYPLLVEAGIAEARVSPRMVYVDDSRPAWVEGFTRNTFTAMIEGIRDAAIKAELMTADEFDRGIGDLRRTSEGGGTFCYTFFKATGRR